MQNFGPVLLLPDSWIFYGPLCTLNLTKMALISNVYLVPISTETEKMGDISRFCRLLTRAQF